MERIKSRRTAREILKAEKEMFSKMEGGRELYDILCHMFQVEEDIIKNLRTIEKGRGKRHNHLSLLCLDFRNNRDFLVNLGGSFVDLLC